MYKSLFEYNKQIFVTKIEIEQEVLFNQIK